jgi:hypothetical protein
MPYLFESRPVISDHFTIMGVNNPKESQKKLKKLQERQHQAAGNLPKLKASQGAGGNDYGMNKMSVFDSHDRSTKTYKH